MAGNSAGWSKASSVTFQEAKDEQLTWAPKIRQVQSAPDATSVVAETLCCMKLFLSREAELLSHWLQGV